MSRRLPMQAALAAWREADRKLALAADGDRDALDSEVVRHRESQRLSSDHMVDRMDALKEAETRRSNAIPSSPPFHEGARDDLEIAAEIWDVTRLSDLETP